MKPFRLSEHQLFSTEKLIKNSLVETSRLFVDLYCLEPGQEQRPHRHEGSDKVYIVLEGRGVFRVGSDEAVLENGEGILAPAGSEHGVLNTGTRRLTVLVCMAPKP
jgi:mannose-6-phosphate isomerase-like protein (cupin superfamily)